MTGVSKELTTSIIRTINTYQTTRCNILEGSHLHTRRDNLKSHVSEQFHGHNTSSGDQLKDTRAGLDVMAQINIHATGGNQIPVTQTIDMSRLAI
jgi:hypothetical protein